MITSINNEELCLFAKEMAKCLNCQQWCSIKEHKPLDNFTCHRFGAQILTPLCISNYWLYDLIGEGGMGFVYLAQQPNDENIYAVKIALKSSTNDFNFQSLLYEGEIYVKMHHPNIPGVPR